MPNQLTGLATDKRTLIFRRVEEILREYPPLSCVKCWQTGNGTSHDNLAYSSGLLPWIRMRPYSTAMVQSAQNRRRHNFGIYIEVITPGTSFDDFMNLWGEVENAMVKDRVIREDGTTVFRHLQCITDGDTDIRAATNIYVEQDAIRDAVNDNKQVIGRYGNGLIMIPFLKPS